MSDTTDWGTVLDVSLLVLVIGAWTAFAIFNDTREASQLGTPCAFVVVTNTDKPSNDLDSSR